MVKQLTIKVNNQIYLLEEDLRYSIKVKDPSIEFEGRIIENMDFEYNGKQFFYLLNEKDNEDYLIAEDEIVSIKRL